MPVVKTADEATEIALSFLKKSGWAFARGVSAHRKNDIWLVEVDVGALAFQIGSVKINARTGTIVEYDLPHMVRA